MALEKNNLDQAEFDREFLLKVQKVEGILRDVEHTRNCRNCLLLYSCVMETESEDLKNRLLELIDHPDIHRLTSFETVFRNAREIQNPSKYNNGVGKYKADDEVQLERKNQEAKFRTSTVNRGTDVSTFQSIAGKTTCCSTTDHKITNRKFSKIAELRNKDNELELTGDIVEEMERFETVGKDGNKLDIGKWLYKDDTASIELTLFNQQNDNIKVGNEYKIHSGFVTEYNRKLQLKVSRNGSID